MLDILKKKILEKLLEQKISPDPENSRWSHQQPFNFFSVFAVFRTLPDGFGTPKVIEWKQKSMIEVEKKKIGQISPEEQILEPVKKYITSRSHVYPPSHLTLKSNC